MKKYTGMLLAAAMLCGLCGCDPKGNTDVDTAESETLLLVTDNYDTIFTDVPEITFVTEIETITETSPAPETTVLEETAETESTVTEREYMEQEETLLGLLSYIQHGCEGECPSFMGNYLGVYDFMKDFRIDGYSYWHRGGGVYDVKLTCSESSCEMFPDGDSYWVYDRGYFYPAERENKIIFPEDMADVDELLDTAFRAACNFSLYTRVFEADEEWFGSYEHLYPHGFLDAYNPYRKANGHGGVAFEELISSTKKLYNVTIPESAFDNFAEDGTDEIICYGHGGSWLYEAFAGYDETDDEIKVRVDYYGDEYYFYAVVESEYTFSKNEDGTITLQKVEKLFDRGYEPAGGSI